MAKTKDASSNKVPALIAAAVVLLLVLVGGGAYAVTTGAFGLGILFEEEPAPPPVEMSEKPVFKKLDKFVVSLLQDQRTRYVMLELSLVSHDPRMPEQADQLNTVIRNALLQYFNGKGYQDVRTEIQNLTRLQENLKTRMITAASNYGEALAVEEVLLTNVVVQ